MNIDLLYVATGTRVEFGVDDINKAKYVLWHRCEYELTAREVGPETFIARADQS